MAHADTERTAATGERSTAINALVGTLVTVVLISVVPFAPLLGGVVAGYLEGRDVGAGVVAGLVSGVAAAAVVATALRRGSARSSSSRWPGGSSPS